MPREPRDTNDQDDAPPDTTGVEPEALQPTEQEQLDARHLTAEAEQHLATHPPTPDDLQTREDRLDDAEAALHTPEPDDTTHRTNEAQTPDERHEPLEDTSDYVHLTVDAERYLADHPPGPEDHDARDSLLDRITPSLQEQPHDPTPTTDAPEPRQPPTSHSEAELVPQEPPRTLEPSWNPPTISEAEFRQAALTQEAGLQPQEHLEPPRTPPDPLALITAFTPSDNKDATWPSLSQRLGTLDHLLDQNPYLRDRLSFDEGYRQAQGYILIKSLQAHNDLPEFTQAETARRLGVSTATLVNWLHDHTQPDLISNLTAHETARRQAEAQLPKEARDHRLDPTTVYQTFRTLRDQPAAATPQDLASRIESLYRTNDQPPGILFADFKSYHESGPRWMRDLGNAVQDHRPEIEGLLNQRLGFGQDSAVSLRIGVVDHTLFIWQRNAQPDNWLSLYNHEYFYFNDQTKHTLMDAACSHLHLCDSHLSQLAAQLTDQSHKAQPSTKLSDLQRYKTFLTGETLHLLLDATGKHLADIEPRIARVGLDTQGDTRGGIHNPKFPIGEPLNEFRARAYAIIVSDGSISSINHALMYVQSDADRVAYIKDLFCRALGEVHSNLETHSEGRMRLTMTVAVGRLLEKWGMPVGDKLLQKMALPDTIKNGTPDIKRAYIQELIPEEGCFFRFTHRRGDFSVKRASVLDAGTKTETYGFQALINPETKVFLRQYGNEHFVSIRDEMPRKEVKIAWGELERLERQQTDTRAGDMARQLKRAVLDNPCQLLEDEKNLCGSLGIAVEIRPKQVCLHESGRVSVAWEARTKTAEDAFRWAIQAPPSSGRKLEAAKRWLAAYEEEVQSIRHQLERDGLIGDSENR